MSIFVSFLWTTFENRIEKQDTHYSQIYYSQTIGDADGQITVYGQDGHLPISTWTEAQAEVNIGFKRWASGP